jgi:hypothetical protein
MNKVIRAKIQLALANKDEGLEDASTHARKGPSKSTASYNVDAIVDETINAGKSWKVSEIAAQHSLSYWTVYRALKGKPGWLPFGRTIRVSNALYRSWIESTVRSGLNSSEAA